MSNRSNADQLVGYFFAPLVITMKATKLTTFSLLQLVAWSESSSLLLLAFLTAIDQSKRSTIAIHIAHANNGETMVKLLLLMVKRLYANCFMVKLLPLISDKISNEEPSITHLPWTLFTRWLGGSPWARSWMN